jgi:hypothetical protein
MPIPGPIDAAIADIENVAASVLIKLRTMRYAGDSKRDIAGLRDLLQSYVDLCMTMARDGGK